MATYWLILITCGDLTLDLLYFYLLCISPGVVYFINISYNFFQWLLLYFLLTVVKVWVFKKYIYIVFNHLVSDDRIHLFSHHEWFQQHAGFCFPLFFSKVKKCFIIDPFSIWSWFLIFFEGDFWGEAGWWRIFRELEVVVKRKIPRRSKLTVALCWLAEGALGKMVEKVVKGEGNH